MSVFVYKMPTTYRCQKRPKSFMENLVGNSRSSHTIVGYIGVVHCTSVLREIRSKAAPTVNSGPHRNNIFGVGNTKN